jgi:hypothetical protein
MSRQFTWWRRFWSTRKMPKQMLYKAASELQQRIEFGEFEVDNLGREYYLEDAIYEKYCADLKAEKPWLTQESFDEQVRDFRKQQHKRKQLIMKAHLEAEHKLLHRLREGLAEEFDMPKDEIESIMENFDGTTRELYFHVKSLALGKTFDPDKQQRLIPEQPRHILKPKERKYVDLWMQLIKENKWEQFLNWNNYQ